MSGYTSTVYGPVDSWRFGKSLGIDPILVQSTCSFDCIYCQLGRIQNQTTEVRVYVPTEQVRRDLESVDWGGVDVVSISGSGEPTLAANIGEIIDLIKERTDKPVHLLTNATMLGDAEVRKRLSRLDFISCKLDAPSDDVLQKMNRPADGISIGRIVDGIVALRREFAGMLALQIMFMPLNVDAVEAWVPLIKRIQPDTIQLNTPRRPYPSQWRLESRGNHGAKAGIDGTALRTITLEQAELAEKILGERTGVEIVSVYRD
ncbi:radical SAM protein [bacterium]|nr:radical SAM protein [bacterium]